MGNDREFKVKDKQGTKDCPDLYCNVTVENPDGAKRDGKYCPSFFSGGLSKQEAEDLCRGLGQQLGWEVEEDPDLPITPYPAKSQFMKEEFKEE